MDTNRTIQTCNATHEGTKQLCHLRHECLRYEAAYKQTFYQQKDDCRFFIKKEK